MSVYVRCKEPRALGAIPEYPLEGGGLGFSLKPPAWLRNIAGAVIKNTKVAVPTKEGGTQTFDFGNPADIDSLKRLISGAKVTLGPNARPSPMEQVTQVVESVPGGWLTVLGVGVLAAFVVPKLMRR